MNEQLAEDNIRLAYYFAHKFRGTKMDYDDLVSAAMFGLAKAVRDFNQEKGAKFSTYAGLVISHEIIKAKRHYDKHRHVTSLDIVTVDEGSRELTLLDLQFDDTDHYEISDQMEIVQKVLSEASKRDREIFIGSMINGEGQTELAKAYGTTQAQVSRIIRNLKKKMREYDH